MIKFKYYGHACFLLETDNEKLLFDRIDEETRIDRATAFRAVLDKMAKEPEENWSLHYMATLLEALLYFMLNEGNEKIDEEEHNEQ